MTRKTYDSNINNTKLTLVLWLSKLTLAHEFESVESDNLVKPFNLNSFERYFGDKYILHNWIIPCSTKVRFPSPSEYSPEVARP
jgi:hypothetical protein